MFWKLSEFEPECALGWLFIKGNNPWGVLFDFTLSCQMEWRPDGRFVFQVLIFLTCSAETPGLLFHSAVPLTLDFLVVFSNYFVLLIWWNELPCSAFRQRGFVSEMCVHSFTCSSVQCLIYLCPSYNMVVDFHIVGIHYLFGEESNLPGLRIIQVF